MNTKGEKVLCLLTVEWFDLNIVLICAAMRKSHRSFFKFVDVGSDSCQQKGMRVMAENFMVVSIVLMWRSRGSVVTSCHPLTRGSGFDLASDSQTLFVDFYAPPAPGRPNKNFDKSHFKFIETNTESRHIL